MVNTVQNSYDNTPTLYVIPTPIGNFGDITLRALDIMSSVSALFCEDTRTTSLLLKKYEIKNKMISSHKYNESKNIDKIISYLCNGLNVGIISDQGTPLISDPGYILVSEVIKHGYNVVCLPGSNAFVPALVTSGIDCTHFLFYGFLDSKRNKRIQTLESLINFPYTLIFYESSHRIIETLDDIKRIMGNNRKISISREISKIHEEIYREKIENLDIQSIKCKGEFVIVLSGKYEDKDFTYLSIIEHVNVYIDEGLSKMEAIKQVAVDRGMKKGDVYREYHKQRNVKM